MKYIFSLLQITLSLFLVTSCVKLPEKEEALIQVDIPLPPSEIMELTRALARKFEPHRYTTLWEQEIASGWVFAQEADFYRAITYFRKGMISLDLLQESDQISHEVQNRYRIEAITGIIASYVLQKKYAHAIQFWDNFGTLIDLRGQEEAKWLLIMMVQALSFSSEYQPRGLELTTMLPIGDPDRVALLCYLAMKTHSIDPLQYLATDNEEEKSHSITLLFKEFSKKRKNPRLAFGLNTFLPGSGYAYIEQKNAAFTSLSMNTLFIGAVIEFFTHSHPMAGLIALGLEFGWWGGGAIGARLGAKEYNHSLWLNMAKKYMREHQLYPEAILRKALQR